MRREGSMEYEQQTSGAAHPLEELTFGERLVLAVLGHRVARIRIRAETASSSRS